MTSSIEKIAEGAGTFVLAGVAGAVVAYSKPGENIDEVDALALVGPVIGMERILSIRNDPRPVSDGTVGLSMLGYSVGYVIGSVAKYTL